MQTPASPHLSDCRSLLSTRSGSQPIPDVLTPHQCLAVLRHVWHHPCIFCHSWLLQAVPQFLSWHPIMSFRSTNTVQLLTSSVLLSQRPQSKYCICSALYFPIHFTLIITLFALDMKLWRLCDENIQLSYIKLQSEDISLIFSLVSGCCLVLNI